MNTHRPGPVDPITQDAPAWEMHPSGTQRRPR
jgi:hypothetical protein